MNYQYIEQLLERYFNCQTTLQEEQILRSFFAQEDVPAGLMQYAELFNYANEEAEIALGEDFDNKMMAIIDEKNAEKGSKKTARIVRMARPLASFFKAAAVVAVFITMGNAIEHAINVNDTTESTAAPVAVNPYIQAKDINSIIRVKNVNQADNKENIDSISTIIR